MKHNIEEPQRKQKKPTTTKFFLIRNEEFDQNLEAYTTLKLFYLPLLPPAD